MKVPLFVFSLLFFSIISTQAQGPAEDLVDLTSVPQWSVYASNYSAKIYSGYLYGGPNVSLHYVFFQSQRSPQTDPLVLWLNGGPGCSSMLGFLYEHGPFVFPDGETTFQWNNYSWNTVANVLYLESPSCVGYSYCENPYATFYDYQTALNNLLALQSFYEKFPTLFQNDLYLAGESYAGVYVPYLAFAIDQFNFNPKTKPAQRIRLKGFMVGNGVTDYSVDLTPAQIDSFYYHNFYSPQTYAQFQTACAKNYTNKDCLNLQNKIFDGLLANLNIYDFYRTCWNTTDPSKICTNLTANYFDLHRPRRGNDQDNIMVIESK